MENYKLFHNEKENRYEFHIEGFKPHVEYEFKDNKIFLTHTRVPEELRGKGVAGKLVKAVLEKLKNSDYKIVSVCDYVKAYLEKHPEYKNKQ